jgi:hypothetical protein
VAAIGTPVDLAVVAVPAANVLDVVADSTSTRFSPARMTSSGWT